MPELAKVLPFPTRQAAERVSATDALRLAQEYLSAEDRANRRGLDVLADCDVLLAICKLLRARLEVSPTIVAADAAELYRWLTAQPLKAAIFDDREYLLGELALISAKAARFEGKLSDAGRWLDRSDAAFRHTVNPAPCLAATSFERLAIRFASACYEDTLELLPSLKASFQKLGMFLDHAKAEFLEAMTLLATGRGKEHFALLQDLDNDPVVQNCPSLHGQVLVHVGGYLAEAGDFESAARAYERALPVVLNGNRPVALCELKWSIGDAYRGQGSLERALESYRAAKADYERLGFKGFATQLSLVIAEALLSLQRDREAEWEILSALPMIEEEKMVPVGVAAVALLRESVRRRKTDTTALRQVREQLRSQ